MRAIKKVKPTLGLKKTQEYKRKLKLKRKGKK
jgi:hypothetical protein